MDIWLTTLLIVAVLLPVLWFVSRKSQRRQRAEFEPPEDIFDAPVGRGGSGSGRGKGNPDHDRAEGDAADGGGDGGGGGGDGGGD